METGHRLPGSGNIVNDVIVSWLQVVICKVNCKVLVESITTLQALVLGRESSEPCMKLRFVRKRAIVPEKNLILAVCPDTLAALEYFVCYQLETSRKSLRTNVLVAYVLVLNLKSWCYGYPSVDYIPVLNNTIDYTKYFFTSSIVE